MYPARLLFALTLLLSATSTKARELHVSQEPLPNIQADIQFRTIGTAVEKLEPGDNVLVHSGIYPEEVVINESGTPGQPISIYAADGESVIITGADRLTDWTQANSEEGVYSANWSYQFNTESQYNSFPDDGFHRLIGRCEQLFINGYALNQVLERKGLGRGTFFVDSQAERLYIWPANTTDLTKDKTCVEASTRQRLMVIQGDYVHLKGIRFRYAANRAQRGALQALGNNLVIEDCVFEYTNSCGATFRGQDLVVRDCTFQFNGQLGFAAVGAHRLLMTGCTVRNNNIKGFDRDWEAGGDKIVLTRSAVFDHCSFVDNRGHGVWYDIGNEDCEVRNCLIANNENAGIFYEISYGLQAHDNVIAGNGLAFAPNAWGASAGISLSSSPGCHIERNLFVGNKEGFAFREQGRTTRRLDRRTEAVWNHDQNVSHNIFAFNRDAQIWGWFDVSDERHWPKSMQAENTERSPSAVKQSPALSKDISLEELQFVFENNLYCLGPGQALLRWGVPWKRHKTYDSLDKVQAELSLAKGCVEEQLRLKDYSAFDLRIPANSRAVKKDCYPRGSVPGVLLGIIEIMEN